MNLGALGFLFSLIGGVCPSGVTQGQGVHLFDTRALLGGTYVNDHTLIQGDDGRWHLYGIFHREPADPKNEIEFVHAVATEPDPTKWEQGAFKLSRTSPIALTVDRSIGERHLWAPHVAREGGRYVMVYQSGGEHGDVAQIRLAQSVDLEQWQRVSAFPLFEDICEARDPMLKKIDGRWVMYYTRCADQKSRVSGVAYRVSDDLIHWSEPKMALVLNDRVPMPNSGFTESPFVFERGGQWYLSVTSYPVDYHASFIYRSSSPYSFENKPVGCVYSHAPEWLEGKQGELLMTTAGWGQGGVYLHQISLPADPYNPR